MFKLIDHDTCEGCGVIETILLIKFEFVFTPVYWGEKINSPSKYGGESKYLNIFSFTLGPL